VAKERKDDPRRVAERVDRESPHSAGMARTVVGGLARVNQMGMGGK